MQQVEAYSCDVQPCSGGHPEWHYQMDIFEALKMRKWDIFIAFPPCTYLSGAGLHWERKDPTRKAKREEAAKFFLALYNAPIAKVAIENPVGWMNTNWKKPTQTIQPYYFGDPQLKRTCLWLRGLKRLNGDLDVALNPKSFIPKPISIDSTTGHKRYFTDAVNRKAIDRSKTFPGIAKAMATQWS